MKQLIKIAHSPDSDDAFMFYALKHGKVTSEKYEFQIERKDIEELNRLAVQEIYDVTAISFHAYAHLADKYALLSSGSSMAEKDYGPMVVAKRPLSLALSPEGRGDVSDFPHPSGERARERGLFAIPGEWTTAFLVLKLIEPKIKHKVIPFEKIIPAVLSGEVDAGLIIHEGQLQYEKQGLHCVVKLIDFWRELVKKSGHENLPLPLGGNAVKKSLGLEVMKDLSRLQKESIEYAMAHHEEARDYAKQFKRDLSDAEADKYLSWYANERTLDIGVEGQLALQILFEEALRRELIIKEVKIEIV